MFIGIDAQTKPGATAFCTQDDTDGWYERIDADPNQGSSIADAIMGRIVHNAYIISIPTPVGNYSPDWANSIPRRHGREAHLLRGRDQGHDGDAEPEAHRKGEDAE